MLPIRRLERCESLAAATDREATIRSGLAIDRQGIELRVGRPWYPCAVSPDEEAFAQQLHELLGAINNVEEEEFQFTPELATHYHQLTSGWGTDVQVLRDRCIRHCNRYEDAPWSATSPRMDKEPEGWRCRTWEEVVERFGTLDILSKASGDGRNDLEDTRVSDDDLQPGTTPRTLELYCGRAGWSAHHKKRGCDAWFLDNDRASVEPAFADKPEYMEDGNILSLNGLDTTKFIHLDFLDFAMAIIKNLVNIGDLHAIHDGLDW